MGTMIHLAQQSAQGNGVPSPVDGKGISTWPLDSWLELMPLLAAYGATVAVTPPLCKGATLGTGYDPFDHFDLGSKPQSGRRETRYGNIDTARRFFAGCRALGMEVYVNVVHHHVDGDNGDCEYRYLGADEKSLIGRFPKDKNCFWLWSPQQPNNPDTVADSNWDLSFGREFRWLSGTYLDGEGANGPGYVMRGLAAALDNQTRRLGVDGYFLDDAKGTAPGYVGFLLSQASMRGRVAFAEYSDGATGNLVYWMNRPEVHRLCGVMDFPLRYKIRDVLNHGADMRSILSEGVCWQMPALAITFLEDIDTDRNDPVIWSKLLGYAMLLTFPGYPMVFLKDLIDYALLEPVLNLIWIHETVAKGDLWWRSVDWDHLVYERMGDGTSSGCLVGVTKSIGSLAHPADWRPLRVQSKWINTRLHDYSGNSDDVWTDAAGMVTIWLPPNDNGRGFCIFAPAGIVNNIRLAPRGMTQLFPGAADLDLPAASDGITLLGAITAAPRTELRARLDIAAPSGASAQPVFMDAAGLAVHAHVDGPDLVGVAAEGGVYTVAIECAGMPEAGVPFELEVSYHAPALPVMRP